MTSLLSPISISADSLLSPLSLADFATDYWGKALYRSGIHHQELPSLLSWEEMQTRLASDDFFHQTELLLRSNSFDTSNRPSQFSDIQKGLENGLTLQVRQLQNSLPSDHPVVQLARTLEKILLQPLSSITFFYSLPGSAPTAIHKDVSEIFSFQLEGKKKWKITDQKCFSESLCYQEGDITTWSEFVIDSGQFMYLPSYLPHQVQCVDAASASVAFVYNNIPFDNILWYLKQSPVLQEMLHAPLPILGDTTLHTVASGQIQRFLDALSSSAQQLHSTQLTRELYEQFSEHIG